MSQSPGFSLRNGSASFVPRGFATRDEFAKSANDARHLEAATTARTPRQFTNVSAELTRNANYVVSKLVATPNALKTAIQSNATGSLNELTSHALVISDETVSVWKYNSSDANPTTINLPVTPSNSGFPPIAHIVSPSAGSVEPGVVIINSHTGHVRYYDNIETASSVGLLERHRGIEAVIRLADREIVTLSEAIEPAGILVTTSTGRVILVSLRDSAGNPFISVSDIVKRQSSYFSFALNRSRQLSSIKAGAVSGQGERVAAMITRDGDFTVRSFARDGQSKVILHQNMFNALLEHISLDPKYNGVDVTKKMEAVDLALLNNFGDQDVFLLLTSIEISPSETSYVTFILRRDESDILLFSAYRIQTYTTPYTKSPQLYVPTPGSTAFVVFQDAIVLVQLPTELDHEKNNKLRKWEDIITFRPGLKIIGSGVENFKEVENEVLQLPSAYVIIPEGGVLRVERLQPDESQLYDDASSGVLKSHIEQAVFYGDDNVGPLEFNLPENIQINPEDLKNDLLEVANQIMCSQSAYLPPRLSSIDSHLQLRQSKLERLLKYTASNVGEIIDIDAKIALVTCFEKVTAALQLYKVLVKQTFDEKLKRKVDQTLQNFATPDGDFFQCGLSKLNELLISLLQSLSSVHGGEIIAVEIVTRAFTAVNEAEKAYRFGLFNLGGSSHGSQEPWFAANEIYLVIDELFEKYVTVMRPQLPNSIASENCVELAGILFYDMQQKHEWLESKIPKTRADQESLEKNQAFYKARSGVWTKNMVIFGAKIDALAIADTYEDLQSLVELSDEEREVSQGVELDNINLRFDYYFNKFGYKFAETLYNYYIHTGKYQALILGFPQYGEYLRRFFAENDHRKISWARDILDGQYTKAAEVLLSVSQKTDDEQSNRHLQLSIAKLSALAANHQTADLIQDIQEELDFVEAQSSILAQIHDFIRSDSDAAAQTDVIVSELLQDQYKTTNVTRQTFHRALSRLLGNKSLSVNELVDIFTLLDSKTTLNKSNCFFALKVLHLSNLPSREKLVNERLIWRRAVLIDDWANVISCENKSNEWIRERAENTVLFETILRYFEDELYTVNNDYQISLPDVFVQIGSDEDLLARFKFIGDIELKELKEELSQQSSQLESLRVANLDGWIKALIGTANEKSGANKVINYNQMTIQTA